MEFISPQLPVPVIKLRDLVTVTKGRKVVSKAKSEVGNLRPIIKIGNLRGIATKEYGYDEKGVRCSLNDILIAWDGTNSGIVATNLEGYVGSTIAKLEILDLHKVNHIFLLYFLKSRFNYLNKHTRGAAIPHIDRSRLLYLDIPLPPMEAQDQVVDILERAIQLIDKQQERLTLLDQLFEAVYTATVGAPEYGTGMWPKLKTSAFVEQIKTPVYRSTKFENKGSLVLGIENTVGGRFQVGTEDQFIDEYKFEKMKRYTLQSGDVIVTLGSQKVHAAVVPEGVTEVITNRQLVALRVNRNLVDPDYLASVFNYSNDVVHHITQLHMKGLTIGGIHHVEIPIPELSVQKQFSRIVHRIQDTRLKMHRSIQDADQLYNTLLQNIYKISTK